MEMQTSKSKHRSKLRVERISMSLPPGLLTQFNKAMNKAGFTDRSKAIQTALHSFIDEHDWQVNDSQNGAGTIMMLYNNHIFNQDTISTQIQHKYSDIINATTHLHLDGDNCLETIMLKGNKRRIKELANSLSKNRGIKSLKVHFVSLI